MEEKKEILDEIIQEENDIQVETKPTAPNIDINILRSRTLRKIFGIRLPSYKREFPKIGRNEKCPCGSGKKYKKCCIN